MNKENTLQNNIQTNEFNFNTELDKYIFASYLTYNVKIYNKNKTLFYEYQYSSNFDISEIYKEMKKKYSNKNIKISIQIKI